MMYAKPVAARLRCRECGNEEHDVVLAPYESTLCRECGSSRLTRIVALREKAAPLWQPAVSA